MVCTLALIYLHNPWLGYTIKTHQIKIFIKIIGMKYAQFCFLEKGMGLVSLTHFVYDI